ncbi:hypothetical protein HPP92_010947 [Vanilla planifolia]|uniref:Uncharacterized protein n=1 Tax=Vanilla planifolia TaxID=51239 RepID=A0A835R0Z6_VANPL|nr:hypothetical protein HPP92_010947 [Vanilla planifolia]
MADIAFFVAEDFERRMKRWEKGEEKGGLEFSSTMAVASSAISAVEEKLTQHMSFMKEVAKSLTEPRSSFGQAVFSCFFSA